MSTGPDLAGRVAGHLEAIYGEVRPGLLEDVLVLAERYRQAVKGGAAVPRQTEGTAYLITYADSVRGEGASPLHALAGLLDDTVGDLITHVHLLPFFPWTSDDGFGVVDYREVNPAVGTWADVHALGTSRELAFDFVANHTSTSSAWFIGWLADDPTLAGYYVERGDQPDVSQVVRPRTSPLFHEYPTPSGEVRSAWTTFGPDQADVNVSTPAVLLDLTDVLLGYVGHGATTVRLDAIGYLVKRSGTSCIHLPETHEVVKLWRTLVNHVRPGVRLLTETNVPHADNISSFGNGDDEAPMVYQFALPPLVLHSFVAGDTTALSRWAATVGPVSETATWFNFLASHDGIGLRPTEGLLSDDDRQALAERVVSQGGRVSLADRPDGSQAVYELNVSYLDALCTPAEAEDPEIFSRKAIAAHSILLSVVGVPALYVHSLFGSRSDLVGLAESGINRRINRAVLDARVVRGELAEVGHRTLVLEGLRRLLAVRREHPAFSPWAEQEVMEMDPRLFVVRRTATTGESVVSMTNVTGDVVPVEALAGLDLLGHESTLRGVLGAYEVAWIRTRPSAY